MMFKKKKPFAELAEVERKIFNLTKLVGINRMINSTLDMGRLLTLIMETIKDIMETEASTLLLYDEHSNDLVFKIALGEAGEELTEKYRVKTGQGIAGHVAETRKPLIVNNVYGDRRFDPNFDKMTGFVSRSIICTPLLFKGKLLGVIQAINPINRPEFTDEDMSLFKNFADQAVLAVQNAIFFQNAIREERITSELSSARIIQETLIPDIDTRIGGVHIRAKSITALEIGGEFHGLFILDDDHIGITMGDLHVKGVPGGMNASMVSGAIRALARTRGRNPVELLRLLGLIMEQDDRPIINASLLYGVLDLRERKLRFLNTGVAYPVLVRDGVARYLRFNKRSLEQNILEAKSVAVSLRPGDLFVIVSDGLLRVKNRSGKHLGLKRVMSFLEEEAHLSGDLIDRIIALANDHTGEVGTREDISIMALMVE
ncbi:MAG: GAF domain-containing protein [Chrysiogenales bacterium]|nr:MAG: GAF domain-containing protein [Chrysiogenales bacterium]